MRNTVEHKMRPLAVSSGHILSGIKSVLKMGIKFNRGATGMNSSQSPGHEPSISTEASVQSKSK